MRRRLIHALAFASLLGAALTLPSQSSDAASRLNRVLIGKSPAAGAPRLDRKLLSGAQPLFLVIDTPYEIWSGMGSYVHVVVYGPSFVPVGGASVYVNGRPVGSTDRSGTLVFRNVPREEGDAYDKRVTAVWQQGGKRYAGSTTFESYRRTESFESAQLFVYTDRGVYNPGQTIRVRAIAWRLRGDFEPLAEAPVEIHLLDAKGRLMGGGRPVTDRFGTVAMSLPLPEAMPEGRYELAVQFEGAREKTDLRVERFVPPAIEIKHDLKRFLARASETLAFSVRLSAFAGPPPRKGNLELRVEVDGKALHREKRTLAGEPELKFLIGGAALKKVKAAVKDGDRFRVVLRATDGSGRSDEVKRDMVLTTNPYTAFIETDKDEYTLGEVAKLQVKITDLDGVPARGLRVRLEVQGAKNPQPAATQASGIALFDLPLRGQSYLDGVQIEAYVAEVEAPLASTDLWVMERKPMLSKVRVPLVREWRNVPIEIAIQPGYTPTEAFVHGDVVDSSGALVSAFLIPITPRGAGWVARGSFKAPTWGTMLLTLFCAAKRGKAEASARNTGLLTEGQQITVEPNKELEVTLTGLPRTAKPGQKLKLGVRVLDARGRAATAALGISMVDAAVLSMLDPLEIVPADRFYNPELKVLSTTGSKILTWPVVTRNWGEPRMDIALPPFGFMAGGGFGGGGYGAVGSMPMKKSAKGGGKAAPLMDAFDAPAEMAEPAASRAEAPARARRAGPTATPGAKAAPTITLRTNFPETALWIDDLVTAAGAARFTVTLPDSITRQRLTVVASDAAGGVQVERQEVAVRQPLVARSDLPASISLGDRVAVRAAAQNLSDKAIRVRLTLSSADLTLHGPTSRNLRVPPQGVAAAEFEVQGKRAGTATYEVSVQSGSVRDTERRTLTVLPAGAPKVESQRGVAAREAPFSASVLADVTTTASLRIAFPGGAGAVQAFRALEAEPWAWLEAPGTRAVTAFHILRLLERREILTAERRRHLMDAIAADVMLIGVLRSENGGVRFMRNGRMSPYLTGRALEGLVAAQRAGFHVPQERLQELAAAVLASVDPQGLVDASDIAWWEGKQAERQMALSAELFRIIAEAGPEVVPSIVRPALGRLRDRVMRQVNLSDDPLTLAHVGLGALAYAERFEDKAIADRVANRLVRRLVESLDRGHWEPSWSNAAGGTIEATAAAMEIVWALDSIAAEPLVRQLTQFLLGARSLYGGWHNPVGTAFTVRALAALPPAEETQRSSLRILVSGAEVKRITIDPRDPFASALEVAYLDLSPYLTVPGDNAVEVRYSGTLQPTVVLETRRVGEPAGAPLLGVRRRLQRPTLAEGQSIGVTLELNGNSKRALVLEETLAPTVRLEPGTLAALREQKGVADVRGGDTLTIYLEPVSGPTTLTYRLMGARPGTATMAPTLVRSLAAPEAARRSGKPTRLTVR